jgi:hypothetical protein
MKKEYLKPAMRAVKLRHRQNLLVGSPGGYDGKSRKCTDDPNDYIFEESDVW